MALRWMSRSTSPEDYATRVALFFNHLEVVGAHPVLGDILPNHMTTQHT